MIHPETLQHSFENLRSFIGSNPRDNTPFEGWMYLHSQECFAIFSQLQGSFELRVKFEHSGKVVVLRSKRLDVESDDYSGCGTVVHNEQGEVIWPTTDSSISVLDKKDAMKIFNDFAYALATFLEPNNDRERN